MLNGEAVAEVAKLDRRIWIGGVEPSVESVANVMVTRAARGDADFGTDGRHVA